MFHKEQLPEDIFQPTGDRTLTLVTCGGELTEIAPNRWVHGSNIVVTAVPLAA